MPPKTPRVDIRFRRVIGLAGWLAGVAIVVVMGCDGATSMQTSSADTIVEASKAKETTEVAVLPEKPVATSGDSIPQSQPQPQPENDVVPDPFPRKLRLPKQALDGGSEWLNAAGPITLESLRGKVVVLDFWTYCCINCMHVLPDLKKLEEKYPKQLVVIGVHSAKFRTEKDSQNIREAILRYEITHPVVNDAERIMWRQFDVQAWPTLMVIDPEGCLVGYMSGEAVFEPLDQAIGVLVKYHRAKGTLNESPVRFELEHARASETSLRFPGKVLADAASDRLFISDSNHNRIVITTLAGKLVDVVGTGEVGHTDGRFDQATFFRPQGLALQGDQLYVADTENHMVRRIDLKTRAVAAVAGIGEQGTSRSHQRRPAKKTALNSPWDLCWHKDKLYIAMAGPHQIWVWDPESDTVRAFAGSGREDIEDGEPQSAAFAQPSGLATDGQWLYVADSEGSSVRAVPLDPSERVKTIVGTSELPVARLFTFGDRDGTGLAKLARHEEARIAGDDEPELRTIGPLLQHPLGVAFHGGNIYVADTYNNKIKLIDPEKSSCLTFLGDGQPDKSDNPPRFDEPGGLSVAGEKLYIADSNNHTIRVADLKTKMLSTLSIADLTPPKRRPPQTAHVFSDAQKITSDLQKLPPNTEVELWVRVDLAEGFELNSLAPMNFLVENDEPQKVFVGGDVIGKVQQLEKPSTSFSIPLRTASAGAAGKLRVSLTYYQCREGVSGICEERSVVWELPVEVRFDASLKQVQLVAPPASPPASKEPKAPGLLERRNP